MKIEFQSMSETLVPGEKLNERMGDSRITFEVKSNIERRELRKGIYAYTAEAEIVLAELGYYEYSDD